MNASHIINVIAVPDISLIPKSKHDMYFVSARDPLERIISAFVYLHPENRRARNERGNGIKEGPNQKAYECFPTLERFAQLLGSQNNTYCSFNARRSVQGRIHIMNHMYGNYQKMVAPVQADAKVYVFRNEHLWEDWASVNKMLAPNQTVMIPSGKEASFRNVTRKAQPVTRELSDEGRAYLCQAIQNEYEVFFSLLNRAVNLDETDVKEARVKAHKNCPGIVAPRVSLNTLTALQVSNTTKQAH